MITYTQREWKKGKLYVMAASMSNGAKKAAAAAYGMNKR